MPDIDGDTFGSYPWYDVQCEICGEWFETQNPDQQFCDACEVDYEE